MPIPDTIPVKVKPEAIDNTDLVKDFRASGGQLLHIRPEMIHDRSRWTRGMTVAFVVKSNRIEIATAVTHNADHFAKKNGTKTAIEHFKAGKTITLPMRNNTKPTEELKYAFRYLCV